MPQSHKTILVSGANRGLGLEFVKQYLKANWLVYAACREPRKARALKQLQKSYSERLKIVALDLSKPQSISDLKHRLRNKPIDILLNNAGIFGPSGLQFGDARQKSWLDIFKVNSIGPFLLIQALHENLLLGKKRLIANISSRMGSIGDNTTGGRYLYRTSKAALNAAMKSAAIDLKADKITVILLHPGWVQTDMGGADATFTPTQSATKLRLIMNRCTLKDSGKFLNYEGKTLPW